MSNYLCLGVDYARGEEYIYFHNREDSFKHFLFPPDEWLNLGLSY